MRVRSTVGESIPEFRLDVDRTRRIKMPEAVYCHHKTVEQCVDIVGEFLETSTDAVIATRATPDQFDALTKLQPNSATGTTLTWRPRPPTGRTASVLCAGTSDLPVASEAVETLTALGHSVDLKVDIGVAGLHRLLSVLDEIVAEVVIVLAGMEGALPTVVAGLVSQPIIAVPTSVGYGTAFDGQTALMSMLTSCAPGISVVGIDNGYGAASAAHRILS